MADTVKMTLDKAIVYQGRQYGPGEVDLPDEVARYVARGTGTTPLPVDFPGADSLRAAGIHTVEGAALYPATRLTGIGPATAARIAEAAGPAATAEARPAGTARGRGANTAPASSANTEGTA